MPKRKWTYGKSRSKRRAMNVVYGGAEAMQMVPAAGAGFLRRGMLVVESCSRKWPCLAMGTI